MHTCCHKYYQMNSEWDNNHPPFNTSKIFHATKKLNMKKPEWIAAYQWPHTMDNIGYFMINIAQNNKYGCRWIIFEP